MQQLQISFSMRAPTCYCPLCELARDEMSALSAVRTPRNVRLHAPTRVVIFFTHLLHVNDVTGIYFLFSFFCFSFTFHKCCYFFLFSIFSFFTFYMSEVFFDNFYMEMILKNYTKTCDYKLHDKFVRTKVV